MKIYSTTLESYQFFRGPGMDITHEAHRKQYETTDFDRHFQMTDDGLHSLEEYFVGKYLDHTGATLEIGTGTGRIAFGLERQKNFQDIIAIDFVEKFIEAANATAELTGSRIKYEAGNAIELRFPDESFSSVISYGVLISHFPKRMDRIKALTEARRVLKPGGILLINALNIGIIRRKLIKYFMKLIRFFHDPYQFEDNSLPRIGIGGKIDFWFFKSDKPCLHFYYPVEFVVDLVEAGFNVLEIISTLDEIDYQRKGAPLTRLVGHNLYLACQKPTR
jgi:ubiquinone/menaquinone biosynthesis C-methylase UbiE